MSTRPKINGLIVLSRVGFRRHCPHAAIVRRRECRGSCRQPRDIYFEAGGRGGAHCQGGKAPELILEMLANINLAADKDLAAKYERIIVIGNRGEITINPRVAMMKELDIRGIALWNATPEQVQPMMKDILGGVAAGALRPIIGREMPLAEAVAAHVAVLKPGAYEKIVLVP
jgi:NADPH:quinone reductase-like Zn-dependent oxidoreductase